MINRKKLLKDMEEYERAEEKAFAKAGIVIGTVKFECPLCKGLAISNRYYYAGRILGLGSYCIKCKINNS